LHAGAGALKYLETFIERLEGQFEITKLAKRPTTQHQRCSEPETEIVLLADRDRFIGDLKTVPGIAFKHEILGTERIVNSQRKWVLENFGQTAEKTYRVKSCLLPRFEIRTSFSLMNGFRPNRYSKLCLKSL
jgi:hypothetical protein